MREVRRVVNSGSIRLDCRSNPGAGPASSMVAAIGRLRPPISIVSNSNPARSL
jgi:hypothetical protein